MAIVLAEGQITGLDLGLFNAGCASTRVRVLAQRHPEAMRPIVARYLRLSKAAAGSDSREADYDAICEEWYLEEAPADDAEAIRVVDADTLALEKKFGIKNETANLVLTEEPEVRVVPSGIDIALAKFAHTVAQVCFPGGHLTEVLHGGHCTITGTSGMLPADRIRAAPDLRSFSWQVHHYTRPPTLQGTLEGRHGGAVHIHRQEGTPGRSEDDTVSVYFTPGCGRAAARKALEAAGFRDFA